MSTSELADLERLLVRVLPDPMGFAERVFQELVGRLAVDSPADGPPMTAASGEPTVQEVLADRNVLLAAALGACTCWGQDPNCPLCLGEGSAGWTQPDRRLYQEYVEPASLRMLGEDGSASRNPHAEPAMEGAPE
jgi:hypothetical protein